MFRAVAAGGALDLSLADAIFVGEALGDDSGQVVAAAGDVDGDGLGDLLIGAPGSSEADYWAGKTYLLLGATVAVGGVFDLSQADAASLGEGPGNESGASVASAGDVDGDGLSDLLVGAFENDDGGLNAGKSYLLLASSIAAGGTFSLSQADAAWPGEVSGDHSGRSVAPAGDVDGDGFDDLLIGSENNPEGGAEAGKVYLFSSPH